MPKEVAGDAAVHRPMARTIPDLLRNASEQNTNAIALINAATGTEMTYAHLSETVSTLEKALIAGSPTSSGRPRIGLVLQNGLPLTVALLAAASAGEATPFNPALTIAEFERYFTITHVDVVVLSDTDNGPAATAAGALGLPVLRLMPSLTISGVSGAKTLPPAAPDDIAMVLMTSGSTGVPKIVPLRHRNVCRSAQDVAQSIALCPDDRCLVMWQQFHIGGLVDLLLAPLSAGGALILTKGFDARAFFDLCDRFAPTWFQGVPTSLNELLRSADHKQIAPKPASLRLIRSVAAALTPATQARLEEVFGVPIVRTLGMTEAGPLITSTRLPPAVDKPGSVGRSSGPEVCVFETGGAHAAAGVVGNIAIRGENVFSGYENNPDANTAAFRDGWFFTGDRGYLDADGDLFLTGRMSEQINRGGYKIMPSEVEEALSRHADVSEVAVFGIDHATLGEDVAAAVTLKAGSQTTDTMLRSHLEEILAANKVPNRILIRNALPRNPVGKLDRMALALEASAMDDDIALLLPPRTRIERRLAEIWMRELELPDIGIRQDFMMVGGDSLSALRIVVAMEEAFKAPMPDAIVENLTTIETVAGLLAKAEMSLPDNEPTPAAHPADKTHNEKVLEINSAEARIALGEVAGKPALDLVLRQLAVYRTPVQVEDLFRKLPITCIGTTGAAFVQRQRLRHRYARKRREIFSQIQAGHVTARSWEQRALNPAATLYFSSQTPNWEKRLIIGFAGNGQEMCMEMYRFLLPLDATRFDFLLLRDTAQQDLYVDGLPEMGDDILELGAWLEEFADSEGYLQRITLGTSGGGLAAIHTGLTYGWDRVVAVCPPRLSKHQRFVPLIKALGATPSVDQSKVLITHGSYLNDIDASRQIEAHLPSSEYDFHSECTKHNLLNYASKEGTLTALYARWFDIENFSP